MPEAQEPTTPRPAHAGPRTMAQEALAGLAEAPRQVDLAMVLWMMLLTAVWGLNSISIRVLVDGMAPIMGAGLRGLVALVLLSAYGRWRGESLWYSGWPGFHGAMNGLLFAGEFVLVYTGARFTNGGHVSLFINTAPFFVAVGAHYLLPGDRLRPLRVLGLVLAFVGVAVLFYNDIAVVQQSYWRGDLLVLAGSILWGTTTLYIKRALAHRMTAFRLLHVQILTSTPVLLAASWLLEPDPFRGATAVTWAMVAYQGVIVVGFTYLMWTTLLRRYPASAMQSFTFLSPVWGVVMGMLLLDELVTGIMTVGIALIGLGLYLVNRPRRAPAS